MKASELITVMQDIVSSKGDLDIYIKEDSSNELIEGVTYETPDSGSEIIILVSITQ